MCYIVGFLFNRCSKHFSGIVLHNLVVRSSSVYKRPRLMLKININHIEQLGIIIYINTMRVQLKYFFH